MKYGFVGSYGTATQMLEIAEAAEAHGWDGFFSWDGVSLGLEPGYSGEVLGSVDTWDAWTLLGAAAARTSRIRLGALVFALPRRHPWKVAREALTLDHLSGGRLVLPFGLGVPDDVAVSRVRGGLATTKERAEALDEALAFLERAWTGEPFTHDGKHFGIEDVVFRPRPVQRPRIPVWVVGGWPRPRSMARAARWDGTLLQRVGPGGPLEPAEVAEAVAWLRERRAALVAEGVDVPEAFDVVVEGELPADRVEAAERVAAFAEAGATWFVEAYWTPSTASPERQLERVRQGPPTPTAK